MEPSKANAKGHKRDVKEPTGRYRWCVGGNEEPMRKQEERTVRRQAELMGWSSNRTRKRLL